MQSTPDDGKWWLVATQADLYSNELLMLKLLLFFQRSNTFSVQPTMRDCGAECIDDFLSTTFTLKSVTYC